VLTEPSLDALLMRPMHSGDVAPAMDLVRQSGWNQTEADWQMMLATGHGFGIEEEGGRLLATSVVQSYRPNIGWIGMVLVDEGSRRRGLATWLLRNAIDRIAASGSVAMLDATPAGRAVYLGLGFRDLAGVGRWRGRGGGLKPSLPADVVRMTDDLAENGIRAEAEAFGADRRSLLTNFRSRPGTIALATEDGTAWLWSRAGRTAMQIGPIVADRPEDAHGLCAAALDQVDGPVLLDVPDRETDIIALLRARGFVHERSLTRMALADAPPTLGQSMRVIAGPELG
jgi:GNAT superfamily N-acetyltransferase